MLRVIAGRYKNKTLFAPNKGTRPTKDMVREAVFSSLGAIDDKVFLDLFAGSGAVGIEALSRGASRIYLNDLDAEAIIIIKKNIKDLKGDIVISKLDYIKRLETMDEALDYIFIDPPYAFERYRDLLDIISERYLLKNDGRIIIETDRELDLDSAFELIKCRRYGITYIHYYRSKYE